MMQVPHNFLKFSRNEMMEKYHLAVLGSVLKYIRKNPPSV